MKNTATISLEEYEQLKNGFENSDLKLILESEIEKFEQQNTKLKQEIKDIQNSDFILVLDDGYFIDRKKYFRKDKTPLWIKKIFN